MATSAGILLYRDGQPDPSEIEVLLVHPGGPMWARRDLGAWSIPKGEVEPGEAPLEAALREFSEEIGSEAPTGEPVSSTFEMAWPPRSGAVQTFPEVDRAEWFAFDVAKQKLNPAQAAFIDRLAETLREAVR
jgi:predicted NUDIX family NTP pyrophosphohydrolase